MAGTHGAQARPDGTVREVRIGPVGLEGLLGVPPEAKGVVVFAHGSGSSRLSPRNNHVAEALRQAGLAALLFDLLLPEEAAEPVTERLPTAPAARQQTPSGG